MTYQAAQTVLAPSRENPEQAPRKVTLDVTEGLQFICRQAYLSTLGKVSETERNYVMDVARGRVQKADLHRIALVARRSTRASVRDSLIQYMRHLAEDRQVMPIDRAILREAIEQAQGDTALERWRYQPTPENLEAAIRETEDHRVALEDLLASLIAQRQRAS